MLAGDWHGMRCKERDPRPSSLPNRRSERLVKIKPGTPYPLGATWDGQGVNFALFSEHATKVELCLFDAPDAKQESAKIALPEQTDLRLARLPARRPAGAALWLPGPTGPTSRRRGIGSPRTRVLLDPYAKAIGRAAPLGRLPLRLQGRRPAGEGPHLRRPPTAPRSPRWRRVRRPRLRLGRRQAGRNTAWHETVIYEVHVKGSTQAPSRGPRGPQRGTYAGRRLRRRAGAPHEARRDGRRAPAGPLPPGRPATCSTEKGLVNYWGYNTLAFLAVDRAIYGGQGPGQRSSRRMVKAHAQARGIEVILDVVYKPHGRGEPDRARPWLLEGDRQRLLLHDLARGPPLSIWTSPAAATCRTCQHPSASCN